MCAEGEEVDRKPVAFRTAGCTRTRREGGVCVLRMEGIVGVEDRRVAQGTDFQWAEGTHKKKKSLKT